MRLIDTLIGRASATEKRFKYYVVYLVGGGEDFNVKSAYVTLTSPMDTQERIEAVRDHLEATNLGDSMSPGDGLVILSWKEIHA